MEATEKTQEDTPHEAAHGYSIEVRKDDDFRHVAMTDEKWFYRTAKNTIEYYQEDEEEEDGVQYDFIEDKDHPLKVMFTGVVCRPVWDKKKRKWTEDGKIGLWRSMTVQKESE